MLPAYVLTSMGLAARHIRSYSPGELVGAPPPFGLLPQSSPNLSWVSCEVPIESTSNMPARESSPHQDSRRFTASRRLD